MTRSNQAAAIVAAAIFSFCLATPGQAAVPSSLNYQGYLTDASGAAIEGSTEMMFTIYSDATSGAALWSSAFLVVPVDQGLFSVQLGGVANPFSPTLFNTPLWLGVTIRGEAEMVPRRPLTTVGFAFKADDALTLTGQSAAALDQSAHVSDTDNPHRVTAPQIDAAALADIADLQAQLDTALASITSLQSSIAAAEDAVVANAAAIAAETSARIAADAFESEVRANADSGHESAIADIQANTVLALDGILTHPDSQTALFSAVNVQVVSGTGSTDGTPTGTGNVIVGYNEPDTSDSPICSIGQWTDPTDCTDAGGVWAVIHKSGSHNVVIGRGHNYSRFGGLVVGVANDITGDWSSVSGGVFNRASYTNASVSGGVSNIASGINSSVSGGVSNKASGSASSISGGNNNFAVGGGASVSGGSVNFAIGDGSNVSGGAVNSATGIDSSVSGGYGNEASGEDSSVSSGVENTASGDYSSVSGGRNNTASGLFTSVSGGGSDNPAYGNHAYANYSSILGGIFNEAGDPASGDRTIGSISAIAGGDTNQTTGAHSSVSGGVNNKATGFRASVSGGEGNEASGAASSVSGGKSNVASAALTSVVGGDDRICTTDMCGEGVISPTDP